MEVQSSKWLSVPEAARLLRTTTPVVRRLIADGLLEWGQTRANGPIKVTLASVVVYRASDANPNRGKRAPGLKSPDPLATDPRYRMAPTDAEQTATIHAARKRQSGG
jgi:hypothetical protein